MNVDSSSRIEVESTRAQSLITIDNIRSQGGKTTSESIFFVLYILCYILVLFTYNDFPRFFYGEDRSQMSDYGQVRVFL